MKNTVCNWSDYVDDEGGVHNSRIELAQNCATNMGLKAIELYLVNVKAVYLLNYLKSRNVIESFPLSTSAAGNASIFHFELAETGSMGRQCIGLL